LFSEVSGTAFTDRFCVRVFTIEIRPARRTSIVIPPLDTSAALPTIVNRNRWEKAYACYRATADLLA
jgi:hypothetical protein